MAGRRRPKDGVASRRLCPGLCRSNDTRASCRAWAFWTVPPPVA